MTNRPRPPRRNFVAALIIAFALAGASTTDVTASNTSSISGTKCTKVGAKRKASGVSYTCAKSGKVLKWAKTVVPAKATKAKTSTKKAPAKKGTNGPVGYSSWVVSISPNPVRPSQPITITSTITCGPIMSLTGSPRYPDMNAWINYEGFKTGNMGAPVLSDGGNTATFSLIATAPSTEGEFSYYSYARDFAAPNACFGDVSTYVKTKNYELAVSNSSVTSTTTVPSAVTAKEGDACTELGKKITNSVGYLECRKVSGGGFRWFSLSTSPSAPVRAAGSHAVSACQLTDQRTTKTPPSMMTGFPALTTNQPLTGAVTYAVIPIDFSDAPGTYTPLSEAQSQMDELANWTHRVSGGRVTITYRTSSTWTRVPSASTAYNLARSGFGLTLAQDAIAAADPTFDFTGISMVLFYLPRTIQGVGEGFNANDGANGMRIPTSEGIIRFWFGAGKYFYADGKTVWSYWAHEIGHSFGLIDLYVRSWASSAPPPMAGFDIMASQDGPSRTLSSWWRFLLGWYNDNQVYCIPSSALTQVTVTLVPIDRSTDGYKAVMVPLTASRILVIESRRREFYDQLFPVGTYGAIAYVIDTTIDNGNGTSVLQVPTGHSTISTPGLPPSHDAFILKGESVTVSGITVTVVESGDYDTVKISK